MTMAPLGGIISSAAGAPLSQTSGSEAERTQKDTSAHQRQVDADQQAEKAAGIGQTHESALVTISASSPTAPKLSPVTPPRR